MSVLLAAGRRERQAWVITVPARNARGEDWRCVLDGLWVKAMARINPKTKLRLCFEQLADGGDHAVVLVGLMERP